MGELTLLTLTDYTSYEKKGFEGDNETFKHQRRQHEEGTVSYLFYRKFTQTAVGRFVFFFKQLAAAVFNL